MTAGRRHVRAALVIAALAAGLAASPRAARAADGAQADLLATARDAEDRADPRAAVDLYRRAAEAAPGSRLSRKAEARLDWLHARAEGDYGPLAELLRARRLAPPDRTPEAMARLVEAARAFPEGRVRREALALAADTYLSLERPREALDAYRAWGASPGVDGAERQLAESGTALALARLGQLGLSIDRLEAADLASRPEAVYLRAQAVSRVLRPVAWSAIACFLVLFVWAARGLRLSDLSRAFSPRRLLFATYFLGPPLALVDLYEPVELDRVATVAAALAAGVALSSIAGARLARRSMTRSSRRLAAALGALATVAAGLLAVDHTQILLSVWMSGPRGGA
jgi:hypothetical protein